VMTDRQKDRHTRYQSLLKWCHQWRIQGGGWGGCIHHRYPQCTETGHL